ncbi:MAG TPA: hypothetical protein VIU61_12430 [Kofleriaceae bacterium]
MNSDVINQLATRIVQEAPVIDPVVLEELLSLLDRVGSPLAQSIARVYELVAAERVPAAIALPHLAMACATLCDPRSTDREHAAAQYEIDTLLPVPPSDRPPLAEPDVPLTKLIRGPRHRT